MNEIVDFENPDKSNFSASSKNVIIRYLLANADIK
jgi:hypothetical protein